MVKALIQAIQKEFLKPSVNE